MYNQQNIFFWRLDPDPDPWKIPTDSFQNKLKEADLPPKHTIMGIYYVEYYGGWVIWSLSPPPLHQPCQGFASIFAV